MPFTRQKRECPKRQEESRQEASHFTGIDVDEAAPNLPEILHEMHAVPIRETAGQISAEIINRFSVSVQTCLFADMPKVSHHHHFVDALARRLLMVDGTGRRRPDGALGMEIDS